jgi:CDI toxin RNase A-like protein
MSSGLVDITLPCSGSNGASRKAPAGGILSSVTLVFHGDRPSLGDARSRLGTIALAIVIALAGCGSPGPSRQSTGGGPQSSVGSPQSSGSGAQPAGGGEESGAPQRGQSGHDLSVDEAMGGHTLNRHIGKTDADLVERLRREPDISSASTYADRETAQRVIGAALVSGGPSFEKWQARQGRRPNYVLRYNAHEVIGRSVRRGSTSSVPCERALVVLRWNDRTHQFYVLTSYPEEHR